MATAESAHLPRLATQISDSLDSPRHSAVVGITHWINTLSFFGLLVSGIAILLAHPRFYWGETGASGVSSVLDLPLPFMRGGPSGWGRNLHFVSAWLCVLNGALYVLSGILTQHFRKSLLPAKADLAWSSIWRVVSNHLRLKPLGVGRSLSYNLLQRLTYLAVVFGLFPVIIWPRFGRAPAIAPGFPVLGTVPCRQQ